MASQVEENVGWQEQAGPGLAWAFAPVLGEMQAVQECLAAVLADTHSSVRMIVDFLLEAPGKRIRPGLVLLAARAAHGGPNGFFQPQHPAVNVGAAVELIHMASLVHDDLVDDAAVRHHRPSVHVKWSKRVAVKLGDYLCAKAFGLVADCADPRLFGILGPQLRAMCEGEIQQVVGRGDVGLEESECLVVVEKKTAALFGACCGAGAVTAGSPAEICGALQEFGRCFGIAFQLLDDCKDLLSDEAGLGKTPGQDLQAGDVTLPLLYALASGARAGERSPLPGPRVPGGRGLAGLCEAFQASAAPARIVQLIVSHVEQAQHALRPLAESDCKERLVRLADGLAGAAARLLETR